jgi:hypothetical protein
MKPSLVFPLALTVAAGLCAAAQGQTTTEPTPPAPPPTAGAPGAPPPHAWGPHGQHTPGASPKAWAGQDRWAKREAERATALHNILGIRPDQETAFQAYALPAHPAPSGGPGGQGWRRPDGQRAGAEAPTPMTAPERAEAMLRRFDDHIARMRERLARRAAAVKTLYAALTPDQRRVFDALPELKGHGGGGGGWGRHGGEGRPPHGPGEGMGE